MQIAKNPLVSIVIPTHNRKATVIRLLKSILANSYKHYEIIVVDDASNDGTSEEIKRKFKEVIVVRNKNNIFTAASRNVGIKNAKGDLIFFIDDDNTLEKHTIERMVEAFQSDEKVGEVGPVNYSFNDRKKILWVITQRNMFTTLTSQPRFLGRLKNQKSWETCDVPNAFMVKSSIIKRDHIYFREKFGIMYEESDFAYRIRNLGHKVLVVREAKIYHDIESTTKDGKLKDYMYHFMEDIRRPYVTARNRILFHSLYSTKFQLAFILLFWIWFFAGYYSYKILFYAGVGNFSLGRRLNLVLAYGRGIFAGLYFLTKNTEI